MLSLFKIFFQTKRTRPVLLLLCLLGASLSEAIGLTALIPTAAAIAGEGNQSTSGFTPYARQAFEAVGIAPTLLNFVLVVAVALVMKAVFSFAATSYAGITSARVAMAFRSDLVEAVFQAKWGALANQRTGKIANVISNDAGRAGEAYLLSAQVIAFCIQVVGYVAVALVIDWRLASAGIAVSVTLALLTRFLIARAGKAGRKQTLQTSSLTIQMVDMLTNLKPLKAMDRHHALLNNMQQTMVKLKNALMTREVTRAGLIQGGDALLVVFAASAVYVAGSIWQMPLQDLIVSAIILLQLESVTSKLQRMLQNVVVLESAHEEATKLVQEMEALNDSWPGRKVPQLDGGFSFKDVSLSYGNFPVLRNVSFEIPIGQITVLKGPSGAGKTTIIDLLIGLQRPSSGEISLGATSLQEIDIAQLRQMIGYVPQDLNLFHASIRENIALGDPRISDEKIVASLMQAGASEFINGLEAGLDTNVGEMGAKLSGGQKQRISLARALAAGPKMLILDEVTSALDPETEKEIVDNISALKKHYTIVVITHRPAWTTIADRLYEVSGGQVKALATTA